MAMTIISQSLCLRSAFTITGENCSGGNAQPQICSRRPVGGAAWSNSVALRTAKRLQICRCLLNQFPRLAQMLFGREHVPEANPHHCSVAQFCLCQISAAGSIDS